MKKIPSVPLAPTAMLPARRRFVHDLALGGVAASLGLRAQAAVPSATTEPIPELRGTQFDLQLDAVPISVTGHRRSATLVNGSLPAPVLRWRQGDSVVVRVRNALPTTSSIHCHGLIVPSDMDGVPGLSFAGIAPGETFTYRFKVNQSGTYWYHSHSRFQEQTGLYGAIVVEPAQPRWPADRDVVVLLSDWSDSDPEHIYATLKKQSDYYNVGKPTLGDFLRDANAQGLDAALRSRHMWNRMRMDPSDLADVSGYTYTYLMNGQTAAANFTALFCRGDKVRLRFINASSMTFFDVRIPGLALRMVAADGQDIEPIQVDEFRIAPAETFDAIVTPNDDRAYTIFAQAMDRSGYVRGTLAPRAGMSAAVPALDPCPRLSMRDMMGAMGQRPTPETPAAMAPMKGMDGSCGAGMLGQASAPLAPLTTGVAVDMLVDTPRSNLDDPGVGLRDNGRRVLTYADLHSLAAPISAHTERDIALRLTGNMQRYLWSFDGRKFSQAPPLRLRYGESVRLTLINDTMMAHPIHLHGMWSELENAAGEFQVRKHTVVVQPAQQLRVRVHADALGQWAFHCHLLYHMEAGMFRIVEVA